MKASVEIKGLRIISISEGTQVGTVKDFILNPQKGSLDFFVVDQPSDYFGAKVIAYADIVGLGEFALTIPNPGVIQSVAGNNEAQELIKQGVEVIGTKVLTKKGALSGEVKEILIDEETGKIAQCLFTDNQGEEHQVAGEQIITYGKELLIIEGNPGEIKAEAVSEPVNTVNVVNPVSPVSAGPVEEQVPQAVPAPVEVTVTEQQNEVTEFNLFEQRQLQYFVGKAVVQDIVLDNGELLRAGEPMTEETIRQITTRNKLMEITSLLHKN
ncbi:PRC-barrel domain-containing protein [Desulfitobacterium hafniense]|uniref:PRC-barrel domain-containing protein n=1 Tax=Desulfitobacterium hafniense TaxID=49338 RepID=UPI00035DEDCB|nr:PRC-barrel domain-containing protein [Desulfitobacterium hafniense]